jgi:hypothetical protein
MQIKWFVVLCLALFIIICFLKLFNKHKIIRHKKYLDISEQLLCDEIIKHNIRQETITELYGLIAKYFKIDAGLLRPSDKIQYFHNLDSFELGENFADFADELDKKYDIKYEDIDFDGSLMDLMIKMQKFSISNSNTTNFLKV